MFHCAFGMNDAVIVVVTFPSKISLNLFSVKISLEFESSSLSEVHYSFEWIDAHLDVFYLKVFLPPAKRPANISKTRKFTVNNKR